MTESPNKSARYVQVRDLLEQAARFHGDLAGFYHRLAGEAVQQRRPLVCADTEEDVRCTSDVCVGEGFHSVVCAPL